jgi:4a-hydroxytetrahydrobiopterin dehydratase
MSQALADRVCVPCRGGIPPMTPEEYGPFLTELGGDWQVEGEMKLVRTYSFRGWAPAQEFVVAAGTIAEAEGHHPDLTLSWGKVRVEIYTHKIKGLAEADFILAAKYNRLYAERFAS